MFQASSLDLEREIRAVESRGLGEVLLLDDSSGLAGMAACHLGAGTEAGGRGCYVKLKMAGPDRGQRCDSGRSSTQLAVDNGADHIELGVNAAAIRPTPAVMARGYGWDWSE